MNKPLLIFDGDCGFCRRWIATWQALTGDRVEYASYQEVGGQFPQIRTEQFQAFVQLVEPDGTITHGAHAVFRALRAHRRLRWLNWMYEKTPGFAPTAEFTYKLVAKHRVLFSKITSALLGGLTGPSKYSLTRKVFLKALGLSYLAAFVSFAVQMRGLVGPDGILPSSWSETSLKLACGVGIAASGLLIAGVQPLVATLAAWASYWVVMQAGQAFLAFQWDALMLEMGFFSIFLTLGKREPLRVSVWLLRWLLFRVVFFSGYVKLASGDPAWRNLTALQYHFETQPLPTWLGWYFHQLPAWSLKISAAGMFAVELGAPLLYFFPRRPRLYALFATVFLQLLIDLTGNYGFFGMQTVALAILLLDDAYLERVVPQRFWAGPESPSPFVWKRPLEMSLVAGALMLALTTTVFHVEKVERAVSPLRSIHSYGVFAVMTRVRTEIIFEGSEDGKLWKPYELKWQPNDVRRKPAFAEPHMPRLDWQLWFAALSGPGENPWVGRVALKLLQGSPEILGFFDRNPFPDTPPRMIRAQFYQYHFTDFNTRRATGAWWSRELLGAYLPAISLKKLNGS